MTSESIPARAYTYALPLVVYTSPADLLNYFGKDLSWLEKGSSTLEVEVSELDAHTDMTVVGNAVSFHFRIMGISIPCRMICLKYKPDRELWWMMIMPGTGWILLRFDVRPDEAGSRLDMGVLGQIDEKMRPLLDNPVFMNALSARADQIMTLIQAEFDPALDVDEILSRGLRGELSETMLMGQRAEVWIQARPDEVKDWVIKKENLRRIMEGFKTDDRYYEAVQDSAEGSVIYAPAVFEAGLLKIDVGTFSLRMENVIRTYVATFGSVAYIETEVSPHQGGTLLTMKFVGEIPAGGSTEVMNMMMFAGGIPRILQDKLLMIKREVEAQSG
ncbi:MAG TPA: hypothetical protein VM658_15605 [bacterium]|nr:hypothetical protein [bacterium]